jgi:hypothetical protein
MKTAIIAGIVSAVVASTTAMATTKALITGAQIKNGSVELVDLSPAAKRALRGRRGLRGPAGPQGSSGAPGAAGATGAPGGFDPAKLAYITGPTVTLPSGQTGGAQATCPAGSAAIAGGFASTDGHVAFSETLSSSFHTISVENDTPSSIQMHATVVCAGR